jgi:hypothetical protein
MGRREITRWAVYAAAALLCAAWVMAARPEDNDFPAFAAKVSKEQLQKFGKAYTAEIDNTRHLIYISALDAKHLAETRTLLGNFTDAYRRTLKDSAMPSAVTIILPTVEDYAPLAPAKDVIGFYRHQDRTLISVDRERVLLHEYTHAMHSADFEAARQIHPIWVREGLATLFEDSNITQSGLQPRVDIRLLTVQKAIRDKSVIGLDKLIAMGDKAFTKDARLCYAQSRYLMLYLFQKGKLPAWYTKYKADFANDPSGLKTLESVMGSPVASIQQPWEDWVMSLKLPKDEAASQSPRIGADFQDSPKGVKVTSLTHNGAAEHAGRLKVGDIIESFNGKDVKRLSELLAALRATRPMETVTIGIVRQGEHIKIEQTLGSANGD